MESPPWNFALRTLVESSLACFVRPGFSDASNGKSIAGQFAAARFTLDAAAGAEFYHKEQKSVGLQIQVANLANRLNVLNFESLFSGTAVAVPRSVSARLRFTF